MISFREFILNETVEHESIDYFMSDTNNHVPLSRKMIERIYGTKVGTAVHVCGFYNVPNVAKIQGTAKSLSCFNWFNKRTGPNSDAIIGVIAGSGAWVIVEGNLLSAGAGDIWTLVDKQGRRWVASNVAGDDGLFKLVSNVKYNIMKKYIPDDELVKGVRKTKMDVEKKFKFFYDNYVNHTNSPLKPRKREIIKMYFDEVEKRLTRMKRSKNEWLRSLKGTEEDYNELVLNKIKIKEVILSQSVAAEHPESFKSMEDCKTFLDSKGIPYRILKNEYAVTDELIKVLNL